jgi:NAD(P)H-nitrite reductase large subunit
LNSNEAKQMTHLPKVKYLIIGNSAGGIGAAETIRCVDKDGSIAIVSDELYPAYSRPLISEYLAEKFSLGKMLFRSLGFYEALNINTILGKKVVKLDTKIRAVQLDDGTEIGWEKLLLATGGIPIIPKVGGLNNIGVFTFTTINDAKEIDRFIKKGHRAVVIGGGLIGVSVTEALVKRGVKVTIVEMKDRILNTILDEELSAVATETIIKHGVRVITEHTLAEVNCLFGTDSVHAVTLDDSRSIPCELVVIAIGVRPRAELASNAGIKVNRGIEINRFMRTSHPDVYACGDVAEPYDFVYGENRLSPIWPNAYLGGRIAGFNMAGEATEYQGSTTMNSLKYFGMAITSAGVVTLPDDSYEVLSRKYDHSYKKIILKNGLLAGMVFAGDIEKSGIVFGLMRDRVNVLDFKQALIAESFGFLSLPEELWRQRLKTAFYPQFSKRRLVKTGVL